MQHAKEIQSRFQRHSEIKLTLPMTTGTVSLEQAVTARKSVREYAAKPITMKQVSQLLWAAQGVTHEEKRSTPSAGGLYPIEIYIVVRSKGVENLPAGIYHYNPRNHTMTLVKEGNFSQALQGAAFDQESVALSALNIVIVAVFERTTSKYGERGVQYVFQESGHISQNIFLQAFALGLGSVAMGAFQEDVVREVLSCARNERPVYIQAIGVERKY